MTIYDKANQSVTKRDNTRLVELSHEGAGDLSVRFSPETTGRCIIPVVMLHLAIRNAKLLFTARLVISMSF